MAPDTDIFLSHNWGQDVSGRDNHERVSIINEELKKSGYQTWFDEERISSCVVGEMAEGIEKTKGVIVFITREYIDKVKGNNAKDNCQLEFKYASRIQTRLKMVAVVMESCMVDTSRWTGPVGIHLGGEIYVEISGNLNNRTYLNKQMKSLQKALQSKGIQPTPGILLLMFHFYLVKKKFL